MRYTLSTDVTRSFPEYRRGVVIVRGANNHGEVSEIMGLLRSAEAELRSNQELQKDYHANPRIASWRSAFERLGVNPNKFRPSVDLMVRRILAGKQIAYVNSLVALCNYVSLRHLVPCGGDDLGKIFGDLQLRLSNGIEPFTPLCSQEIEHPLAGEIIYADDATVLCRCWVWHQGELSKIDTDTSSAALNVDCLPPVDRSGCEHIIAELASLIERYLGGTTHCFLLGAAVSEIHFEQLAPIRSPSSTAERTTTMKSIDEQVHLLMRGTRFPEADLRQKMESELRKRIEDKGKLTVYLGVDPTTPDLHLGHTVPIQKLKHFQDLGHDVVFLIGDFTGMIGDPTGRVKTRPPLTREQLREHAETYTTQVFKILDPRKTRVVYNSEWLDDLTFPNVVKLAGQLTVAQLLNREDFNNRYKSGLPIGLHEFLYCLMQGYDAIHLETDVQVGGVDQLFNLVTGRDLQVGFGQKPQIVLTLPLLVGTDGFQKMSKTYGNAIGIDEPPEEIYGKVMSITDHLIESYFELVTDITPEELEQVRNGLAASSLHPRDAKMRLARQIVARFHSSQAAEKAERHFVAIFQQRSAPADVPEVTLSSLGPDRSANIIEVLAELEGVKSRSEARRLVRQRAVRLDDQVIDDEKALVTVQAGALIQVGKRRFYRIQ